MAEAINGLFKAEVIWRRGPWRSLEAVEYATLEWVDWFNNTTTGVCLSPLATFRQQSSNRHIIVSRSQWPWPHDSQQKVSGEAGAVNRASRQI